MTRNIDRIVSHFYELDKNQLKSLPIEIVQSFLSSKHLKAEDEDSLFEEVNEAHENEEEFKVIEFNDEVELDFLSKGKPHEFISKIEMSEMTNRFFEQMKSLIMSDDKENRETSWTHQENISNI